MSKKTLKLAGRRRTLLALIVMATITIGLLFSGWLTPTPGKAQQGGGNGGSGSENSCGPQSDGSCVECGPHWGDWIKDSCPSQTNTPGVSPATMSCAKVGDPIPMPTVTPPGFSPGSKHMVGSYDCSTDTTNQTADITYTVSSVYWDPPIPKTFTDWNCPTFTSTAYVDISCSDSNLCSSGTGQKIPVGSCTWDVVDENWKDKSQLGVKVALPEDIKDKINGAIHNVPGLSGVTINEADADATVKVRDCCDANGNPVSNGQTETESGITLSITGNGILIYGIPAVNETADFGLFVVNFQAQGGVYLNANLDFSAAAGALADSCGNQNCNYGTADCNASVNLYLKLAASICASTWWSTTDPSCAKLSITPIDFALSTTGTVNYNKPCGSGLTGQVCVGSITATASCACTGGSQQWEFKYTIYEGQCSN